MNKFNDYYQGMFVGLAICDTLGMAVEFKNIGEFEPLIEPISGGPFSLPLGYWTDDTSMALCLADSLLEKSGYDSYDVMEKYLNWRINGYRSSTGKCFDIGNQVSTSLNGFMRDGGAIVELSKERTWFAGNGSIMRLAPIIIASHAAKNSTEKTLQLARISARETHYSYEAEAGTIIFALMLLKSLQSKNKKDILEVTTIRNDKISQKFSKVLLGSVNKTIQTLKPTGYIIDSLECATWAFMNSNNFKDGALMVVNLGGDSDTIGAIYGQLAGSFYGYQQIPNNWCSILYKHNEIKDLADSLSQLKKCDIIRTRFDEDGQEYLSKPKIISEHNDITALNVDVIVNAANTQLIGGSGVCGAIFDAAGYDQMSEACREIGICEYGDAVITDGFNLPANYVIHTVGPIYGQHNGEEPNILKSCYWQSLRLAHDKRLKSIAFPLISTGVYGYPEKDAIALAVQAINEFIEDNPRTTIDEVTLCAFNDSDKQLIDKLLNV